MGIIPKKIKMNFSIFFFFSLANCELLLTSFGSERDLLKGWKIKNDAVAGGFSKGHYRISHRARIMKFWGKISTKNNGGWSYIQSKEEEVDLSGFNGVKLRVRGDGRTYTVDLQCDERYISKWGNHPMSFIQTFETKNKEWTEVSIPFKELNPNFWGNPMTGRKFNEATFNSFGLYIDDKTDGPFGIEIDWIRAY